MRGFARKRIEAVAVAARAERGEAIGDGAAHRIMHEQNE